MNNQQATTNILVILAIFGLFAWSAWNMTIALGSGFEPSYQSWFLSLLGGSLYAIWMYSVAPSSRIIKKRSRQLKIMFAYAVIGISSVAGIVFKVEPLLKPHQISSCYRRLEDKRTWRNPSRRTLHRTYFKIDFIKYRLGSYRYSTIRPVPKIENLEALHRPCP